MGALNFGKAGRLHLMGPEKHTANAQAATTWLDCSTPDPQMDLEICGTADPNKKPDIFGQGSSCSGITSGCGNPDWFVSIEDDFKVQQQFTNEGFCTVLYNRYPPADSEEITTVVNGMKVDITVPAAHLAGSVSACGSRQEAQPDGTVVTVLTYPTIPVVLSGKITMTYDLEPWEEEAGTCCLPTGDCLDNSTAPACYELCGVFTPDVSAEECKNGIPGVMVPCSVDTDYFYCWDFINGQPPPTWTPAGPIGTECDYATGPTVVTDPTTFATTQGGRSMPTTTTGPGTHLKNMLGWVGIRAKEKGCKLPLTWKRRWNAVAGSGAAITSKKFFHHLGKRSQEARNLMFVKLAASKLVDLAIRRAERGQ